MGNLSQKEKQFLYDQAKVNKSTIWILFLFLGWSYGSLGQGAKQFLFYITLGGFGLWSIYVLFTLNKKIEKYNREQAQFYNVI